MDLPRQHHRRALSPRGFLEARLTHDLERFVGRGTSPLSVARRDAERVDVRNEQPRRLFIVDMSRRRYRSRNVSTSK